MSDGGDGELVAIPRLEHSCQRPNVNGVPAGEPGTEWRCHCGILWRIHAATERVKVWRRVYLPRLAVS